MIQVFNNLLIYYYLYMYNSECMYSMYVYVCVYVPA
jgi:hypothetical protein